MRIIILLLILLPVYGDNYRGWDHLAKVLKKHNVSDVLIKKYLNDPRLPKFGFIPFKLKPVESHRSYSGFYKQSLITEAREHLNKYNKLYLQVQKEFNVAKEIIAAILLIETHYGKNTGEHRIFERLARVCSVKEENNLIDNYKQHLKLNSKVKFSATDKRAQYLEDQFCPQLVALIKFNTDIFEIKGSIAGAFGMPQFMPESYQKYGVDFDGNGSINLFAEPDAIASVANFLNKHGYNKDKKHAVWGYNHSKAYNDTIFNVAKRLGFKE